MPEDLRPPYRIQFDNARDPYTARNALGISASTGLITSVTAPLAVTGGNLTIDLSGTASSADFPAGAWSTWSPTISASSGTITSSTVNRARYTKLGKSIIAVLDVTITNAGSGTGLLMFTLPVAVSASGGGICFGREIVVGGAALVGQLNPSDASGFVMTYNALSIVLTGAQAVISAIYEGV